MGAGTIADITPPAKRAFAMSIFSLGPQLGPVTGGVIGGALAGNVSWRWIFGLLGNIMSASYPKPSIPQSNHLICFLCENVLFYWCCEY